MPNLRFPLGTVGLLLLWQGASVLLSPRLVPAPIPVLKLFSALLPGVLGLHTLASIARTLAAVAVSSLFALPLGILLGRSVRADRVIGPLAYLLYPVPKIAFLPVFMLLLGIGDAAKIALVTSVIFFQMLVMVRDTVRDIPREYTSAVLAHGGGRVAVLRFVVLPASLSGVFTALRLAGGTSLAVLFFAETFFTTYGLGQFIMDAWSRIDYPRMFAGIVAMSLAGRLIFLGVDALERVLCPWKKSGEKKEADLK
jgi:NitT/TauT family transport system permease protein